MPLSPKGGRLCFVNNYDAKVVCVIALVVINL
jgi:hypothetical protein